MGVRPPPIGGIPCPRRHEPRRRPWSWYPWRARKRPPSDHRWRCQQARRRYPPALKKEEAGILQFEVSSISPRVPTISRGGHSLFCFFAIRVTPIIPTLAPAKALKLGTPAMTRRRSERAPRTAASAAAMGEPSRVAAAAAGLQQEEVAAVSSQALVPRVPSQGCGQARLESRAAGDHGAAEVAVDDDAPPGGAN
jgi:hypothetical protein